MDILNMYLLNGNESKEDIMDISSKIKLWKYLSSIDTNRYKTNAPKRIIIDKGNPKRLLEIKMESNDGEFIDGLEKVIQDYIDGYDNGIL